jgi:hypothetical protein
MCCGQKRSLLSSHAVPSQARPMPVQVGANPRRLSFQRTVAKGAAVTDPVAPAGTTSSEMALRYLRAAPVRVRGLITGRTYEFSGPQSVALIDPRDVPGLQNTGLFRRG